MPWNTSPRRQHLPPDWTTRRTHTRERAGGQCEAHLRDGTRCTWAGTDCDHIEPGNNHSLDNLQWLCTWHHKQKTQAEARAAHVPRTNQRPTRKHPGLN